MIWSLFATLSMLSGAAQPILQQKFQANSFAMLFWMRIITLTCMIPAFVYFGRKYGFPDDPLFYGGALIVAMVATFTDLIFFNAVKKHGAAVCTRLLPGTALITFIVWFVFDHALLAKYLNAPWQSAMICAVLIAGVFFATRLKKCEFSLAAARDIWPVLVFAAGGPVFIKHVLALANPNIAPYGYVMVQAAFVATVFLTHQVIKHPVPRAEFVGTLAIKTGILIGMASMVSIVTRAFAVIYVDNPAYVGMILFTAPFFVGLYDRLMGRPDESHKWAGYGLILCAILLALLKIG